MYVKYTNYKYDDELFKTNLWKSQNKISNRNVDFKKVNLINFLKFIDTSNSKKKLLQNKNML